VIAYPQLIISCTLSNVEGKLEQWLGYSTEPVVDVIPCAPSGGRPEHHDRHLGSGLV
jgi:hypothetical protein